MHIYINGKRWKGKGKKFNYLNENIIFEGEYINGKKNGKCKEYHKSPNAELK